MLELADSTERLLADSCTLPAIRAIESGASAADLWRALHESGFMDALVPEPKGGSGLSLREAFPVLFAAGKYAVPVPFAPTLMARALLAHAEQPMPEGPITIADAVQQKDGAIACARVPYGRVAQWALVQIGATSLTLLPIRDADVTPTGVHASLEADLRWTKAPAAAHFEAPIAARVVGACVYAAQLAGAMQRILDITVRYANERVQFGRPIAKFQAIQHHLSVIAEQTFAARMAAEMSCRNHTHFPDTALAAVGKARASEAAVTVAALGHAVHGAIGFTDEYELQLHTRRLYEWRLAYGSDTYWNERIGAELLRGNATALDFIRTRLFPASIDPDEPS
ncbi:MAG: acyl-CoA dehydrogenase family protein [Sulfurifustaceae bacterium]